MMAGAEEEECLRTQELDIAEMIKAGDSKCKISGTFHISIHTYNSHRKNIRNLS